MDATTRIKEYLQDHGPSTWSEIQYGTNLSKGTLANVLSDTDKFTAVSTPSTLYSVRGTTSVHRMTNDLIIRNMLRDLSNLHSSYNKLRNSAGRDTAEAKAEVAMNKLMEKYGAMIGRMTHE